MALAITPREDFGDSRFLRGFKSRSETLARTGPHSRTIFSDNRRRPLFTLVLKIIQIRHL